MLGGATGFVVETGDMNLFMERALWLADHDVARAEMGREAAIHASHLDWTNVYEQLMEMFRKCAAESVANISLSVAT